MPHITHQYSVNPKLKLNACRNNKDFVGLLTLGLCAMLSRSVS